MKNNKKQLIVSIVAIVLIVVLVVTATYAYFASQTGDPASTDIKVTTATVDSLTFSTGDAISLSATQSNFGTGDASLSASTTATATLVPNNSTNSAEATYYLYVKISSNDFVYTTDDSTAELILSITGPDGEVTSLSGLTYTTVEDNTGVSYSGFDVTTTTGTIAIAELYSIVADGDTQVDDWTITLTFVNLSTDQSQNAGAGFEASVIIQADKLNSSLASYIMSLYTTDGENNLYYFDGEGTYTNANLEAVDYSYRYAGASDSTNNFVCFGSDSETCEDDNLYRIVGFFLNDSGEYEMKLIKWDYANSDLLGEDGDYYYYISTNNSTYSASGYLNYTGSHETINRYYWNYANKSASYSATGYYNDWSYSALNTVNLNTNYYNNFDSIWQDMISDHIWIIGGGDLDSKTASSAYSSEILNPSDQLGHTTYNTQIGLMYVSDYGFAAEPTYWSTNLSDYDEGAYANDWMYMGIAEWTISRYTGLSYDSFYVGSSGGVGSTDTQAYEYGRYAVRPTFYLDPSTTITDGTGTQDNPYRISL